LFNRPVVGLGFGFGFGFFFFFFFFFFFLSTWVIGLFSLFAFSILTGEV
jgi:hypothetical protein